MHTQTSLVVYTDIAARMGFNTVCDWFAESLCVEAVARTRSVARAASMLQVPKRTLYYRLQNYARRNNTTVRQIVKHAVSAREGHCGAR